jgi:nucleoside phosphorylase
VATTRVIQRWQPEHVLMVGIAGGVPGKVALGDVVVAESI